MISIIGCQNNSATPAFQKELVKFLKTKQNQSSERCDPAFVTLRDEELSIYCLPLVNSESKSSEIKDAVRFEVDSLTRQWSKQNQKVFKSIRTRFTDEIMSGPAK